MADPREPSMENILASIKKVIAEEKELRAAAPPPMPHSLEPEEESEDEEEVLELDELVGEETVVPELEPAPPLVSDDAALASRQRLAELQEIAATAPPPQPQANPLEQVVRDMLRPILKEWLDQHLPQIVDEHVKREISRITGTPL